MRYTLQRPGWPCTTHTPSATSFASPAPVSPSVSARLDVERAHHALLGGRAQRRHHPELARHRHRVGERVVGVDQPVAHRQDVDALELHPVPGGRDAVERARPRERAAEAPLQRAALVLAGGRDDLDLQIRDRFDEAADELAHAVGADEQRPGRARPRGRPAPTSPPRPRRRGRRSPRSTVARPSPPRTCRGLSARAASPPRPARWRRPPAPSWPRCSPRSCSSSSCSSSAIPSSFRRRRQRHLV